MGAPLEQSAVEMGWREFSHSSRAIQCGAADDLVLYLAEYAKLLGLVKRWRKHLIRRGHQPLLILEQHGALPRQEL